MEVFMIIVLLLNVFVMLTNCVLYSRLYNYIIESKELIYSSSEFWEKGDNL